MVFRELDKQALKENSYTVLSKITLLNDNSVFTEDDFIVDWTYEDYRYVPNQGFIGQFVERILDGNLQNIPDNKIFENQEINLQIAIVNAIDNTTTWYDYGNFLITSVEKTDTTGNYKFESADYTKKFNKEYEDNISYPCLAMELAYNVCGQADVELDTVDKCYIYIADENGLSAGNYSFKIENNYYNFTLQNALEKNDVLYFPRIKNELILRKVRYSEEEGYVLTREVVDFTIDTAPGSNIELTYRYVPYCDFTNNDFLIENNQYDEKDTLRKVMQDIGKLAYSWVRIGEDNKVHIDYAQDASIDEYDKLSTNEYYVSKKADLYFGPVNKVLLGMSNIEGENLYKTSSTYTEETECAIKIYDNNLAYTEELRAIALNGCERLFGIEYMPLEIETIGHPWLDGNEMIELTNVDDEVLYTYPFNRKITYKGYIEGVIGSEAETKQDNEYEYESEIVKQVNKTSITVDKNNKTITGLVSDVNGAKSDISTLQQTTNEISATVEHLDNEYEQNVVVRKNAEGNPIEIEDAGNYQLESFRIYGNTEQETTGEEAGTTIQVNQSATLNDVDTTKKSRVLRLLGQTSQETTTGKNKLAYSLLSLKTLNGSGTWNNNVYTHNGVTFTINEDLSVTVNGTASNNAILYLNISADMLEPNTQYIASGVTNAAANNYRMQTNIDGTMYSMVYATPVTFTTPSTISYYIQTYFVVLSGKSITNKTIYPMIRLSSVTDDTYEPYTNGASPNPSYPQPINVVSGDNTIDICGKNLININGEYIKRENASYSNISVSNNILSYTITSNVAGYLGFIVPVEPGQRYTISYTNLTGLIYVVQLPQLITEVGINYGSTITSGSSFLASQPFVGIWLSISTAQGSTGSVSNLQLEKGNIASPVYEPYIGNSYPIYLGVENLFDGSGVSTTTPSNWGVSFENNILTIEHKTSYSTGSPYIDLGILAKGTYIFSMIGDFHQVGLYRNNVYDTMLNYNGTTFEVDGSESIKIYFSNNQVSTITYDRIQIEKGTKINSFTPYGTTPIELCKIGTYQDYIYKDNGKWYLHKEIGKLDMSTITGWQGGNTQYCKTNFVSTYGISSNICLSNIFTYNSTAWYGDGYFGITSGGNLWFKTSDSSLTDANNVPTWLSNKGGILYGILTTPTNTEITDTTLLEQLEALKST